MTLRERLQTAWFDKNLAVFLWPLMPLSVVFGVVAALRRGLFRWGIKKAVQVPVPVVVVGNLIVGGAGKTPATLALVEGLKRKGWHPGIVSRGYGGASEVAAVHTHSDPAIVGDEPVLLAWRSGVPVFVGRQRAQAAQTLLAAHPEVDVIVCDDGLQHYALVRDVEIAVFDARAAGNGFLLPAGPLREPIRRLASVDAILRNSAPAAAGSDGACPEFSMQLEPGLAYRLNAPEMRQPVTDFAGQQVFALAGIGHPQRFFNTLAERGLVVDGRAFPDHHPYVAGDLAFAAKGVLLMTEKDAMKCRRFATDSMWVVPVTARIEPDLVALVAGKIAPLSRSAR